MKERPILFSSSMVRAILSGTKTQTRRVIKPQPHRETNTVEWNTAEMAFVPWRLGTSTPNSGHRTGSPIRCPYGAPGDRLWVREAFYCDDFTANDFDAARTGYVGKPPSDEQIVKQWRRALDYRADHDCRTYEAECPCSDDNGRSCWKPSIHMPRWASRITLEVTGVRVERLQEISEEDARAEGVEACDGLLDSALICRAAKVVGASHEDNRGWFAALWAEISGWDSLVANPWVWVVEFRRLEAQERAA